MYGALHVYEVFRKLREKVNILPASPASGGGGK
jgi:hypothetical protein